MGSIDSLESKERKGEVLIMDIAMNRWPLRALFLTFAAFLVLAACETTPPKPINASGGIAIKGAGPVAYFTEGKALKGKKEITYDWKGATWRFASAENRELFKADPVKYAPQYGGYCAYNLTQRTVASIDPNAWKIVDNKLYLLNSVAWKNEWQQNTTQHIKTADKVWADLLAK